jgi:hypothetical protein
LSRFIVDLRRSDVESYTLTSAEDFLAHAAPHIQRIYERAQQGAEIEVRAKQMRDELMERVTAILHAYRRYGLSFEEKEKMQRLWDEAQHEIATHPSGDLNRAIALMTALTASVAERARNWDTPVAKQFLEKEAQGYGVYARIRVDDRGVYDVRTGEQLEECTVGKSGRSLQAYPDGSGKMRFVATGQWSVYGSDGFRLSPGTYAIMRDAAHIYSVQYDGGGEIVRVEDVVHPERVSDRETAFSSSGGFGALATAFGKQPTVSARTAEAPRERRVEVSVERPRELEHMTDALRKEYIEKYETLRQMAAQLRHLGEKPKVKEGAKPTEKEKALLELHDKTIPALREYMTGIDTEVRTGERPERVRGILSEAQRRVASAWDKTGSRTQNDYANNWVDRYMKESEAIAQAVAQDASVDEWVREDAVTVEQVVEKVKELMRSELPQRSGQKEWKPIETLIAAALESLIA